MTVPKTKSKEIFVWDNVTDEFAYPQIQSGDDLYVSLYTNAGAKVQDIDSSKYSLSNPTGVGVLTITDAPTLAVDADQVVLRRIVDYKQELDLGERDFPPEEIEAQFDKETMTLQQLEEFQSRSVVSNILDNSGTAIELPVADEGKILLWDADGNLENGVVTSGDALPTVADTYVKRNAANTAFVTDTLPTTNAANIATNTSDISDNTDAINNITVDLPKGFINGGKLQTSTNLFPKMTSNTTPSGEQSWATSAFSGSDVYIAFDGVEVLPRYLTATNASMASLPEIILRKMSVAEPIRQIDYMAIEAAATNAYPINFDLVYTTDDMSGYSTIDTTLRDITFTTVKTVSGATWADGAYNSYELDSEIPITATAFGIVATSGNGDRISCVEMVAYNETSKSVEISAVKARSDDDTFNFDIGAGSLDITNDLHWASGTAPTLTNASIHVWLDENVFEGDPYPKYTLDDSTGSNITVGDAKRRVGSFITDASGDIVPFIQSEMAGGGIKTMYRTSIEEFSGQGTGAWVASYTSIPANMFGIFTASSMTKAGTTIYAYINLRDANGLVTEGSSSYGTQFSEVIYKPNYLECLVDNNSQIEVFATSNSATNGLSKLKTLGYTDERIA